MRKLILFGMSLAMALSLQGCVMAHFPMTMAFGIGFANTTMSGATQAVKENGAEDRNPNPETYMTLGSASSNIAKAPNIRAKEKVEMANAIQGEKAKIQKYSQVLQTSKDKVELRVAEYRLEAAKEKLAKLEAQKQRFMTNTQNRIESLERELNQAKMVLQE